MHRAAVQGKSSVLIGVYLTIANMYGVDYAVLDRWINAAAQRCIRAIRLQSGINAVLRFTRACMQCAVCTLCVGGQLDRCSCKTLCIGVTAQHSLS